MACHVNDIIRKVIARHEVPKQSLNSGIAQPVASPSLRLLRRSLRSLLAMTGEAISLLAMTGEAISLLAMTVTCFVIIMLSGCSEAMMNLKDLGDNRQQTEEYVRQQKELFARLSQDIKNNRLKVGTSRKEILAGYSQPVAAQEVVYQGKMVQSLVFRDPVKFFSCELIHLYFDKEDRLCGWEIQAPDDKKT